ncbi:MAG: heme exporter protein CcmB, partial [Alphaproteobacteria bacterium]|nr:heme exporter protein CcmB [Alphaproteobacteria bacterium]
MRVFLALLGRDLALTGRQGGESGLALLFFVLGAVLFPLGLGPDPGTLAGVGSGLLWVIALLAALLSLERLFRADWEDGTLDLLVARPEPLVAVVLAKCAAHWLATGLPMAVIAPLLGSMLAVPDERLGLLTLSFLIGTPALTLIGSAGAALT